MDNDKLVSYTTDSYGVAARKHSFETKLIVSFDHSTTKVCSLLANIHRGKF